MKHKQRRKKKALNPAALRRIRRANLAQNYYRRAKALEVTTSRLAPRKFRVIAECFPSTAIPNIMGVVDGTKKKCDTYVELMRTVAAEMGLEFKEVITL